MIILLDTSSLLALTRYYLPFDDTGLLKQTFHQKVVDGEFQIIDKIADEAKVIAKKVIVKEMPFSVIKPINTTGVLPTKTFINLTDNQFCDKSIKRFRAYTEVEYEAEKRDFLESADAKLILYAMANKVKSPIIVTEERESANDNKLFRKIPFCCKEVGLDCCTITDLLKDHLRLNVSFSKPSL